MIADRNIDPQKFCDFMNAASAFFTPQVIPLGISLDEYTKKLMEKGTIAYFEEGEVIVGAVMGYTHDTPDNTSYITQVYILPEFRGRGLSHLLLKEYCTYCAKCGLDQVWLTTKKDNYTAQKAYERAGFFCEGDYKQQTVKYIKQL